MHDSGSAVSLIKTHLVKPNRVNSKVTCILAGVTGDCAESLGMSEVEIGIQSDVVNTRFNFVVCSDNLLVLYDGLLGRDFLKVNRAQVDYAVDTLYIWGKCIPLKVNTEIACDFVGKKERGLDLAKNLNKHQDTENDSVENQNSIDDSVESPQDVKNWVDCQTIKRDFVKSQNSNVNSVEDCRTTSRDSLVHPEEIKIDRNERKLEIKVDVNVEEYGDISDTDDEDQLYYKSFKQRERELGNRNGNVIGYQDEQLIINENKLLAELSEDSVNCNDRRVNDVTTLSKTADEETSSALISADVSQLECSNSSCVQTEFAELPVKLKEDIVIPPRYEVCCLGDVRNADQAKNIFIEPCNVGQSGIIIANVLGNNKDSCMLRLANISNQQVVLKANTLVGYAVTNVEVISSKNRLKGIEVNALDVDHEKPTIDRFPLAHLNGDSKELVEALIAEYEDIFSEGDAVLSSATKVKHAIITDNVTPIAKRPYRVPYHQKEILQKEIDRLLEKGVIRPSSSPWSAPVVLIVKKLPDNTMKVRMCIDYRGLNAVTKRDYYPLPNLQTSLDQLGNANLFSVFDVTSAYHQIDMEEVDKPKTAFSTPDGHWEFNKMPFGLSNSPSTFQRFMNVTLSGLTGDICLVYLDDILVFNHLGPRDHIGKLKRVFDRLREANIKLKPSKSQFLMQEVKYLGHLISKDGIKPDPEKFSSILNFPIPKDITAVRSFLGLVGWYRRFIRNYAQIAEPLTNLTKKNIKFEITQQVLESIHTLKHALTTETVLAHPNFTEPFILATDASILGIGAILSQIQNGIEKPIAFFSRKLNKAQKNYSVTELECLAVVEAVKHFKCYLYGQKFTIITDHRPLKWLLSLKDPTSRLARWSLLLSSYDFEIVHRPGKKHGNVDALSRYFPPTHDEYEPSSDENKSTEGNRFAPIHAIEPQQSLFIPSWDREYILREQRKDQYCSHIINQLQDQVFENFYLDKEGLLYKKEGSRDLLVIPRSFVRKVLYDFHSLPFFGHKGQTQTLSLIKTRCYWPGMKADVVHFCQSCHKCNQRKTSPHLKKNPLQSFPEVVEPFERTAMDIVGPFVTSYTGNKYLLTFQDYLTKYIEAIPLPDQKADTVAKAFITQIIARHGVPKQLLTDQGRNFVSSLFQNVCKFLRIEKLQTTPYHPETNGMIERSHRVFNDTIAFYVNKTQQDWDEWVPYALMAYRFNIHTSTGFSPFFALYGRDPVFPFDEVLKPQSVRYDADQNYTSELISRLHNVFHKIKENLQRAKEVQSVQYNKRTKASSYQLGDLVYLHDPSTKVGLPKKLTKPWIGPYRIIEVKGPVTYKIRELNKRKDLVVHVNRLKPYLGNAETLNFNENEKFENCIEPQIETDSDELLHSTDDFGINPEDATWDIIRILESNKANKETEMRDRARRTRRGTMEGLGGNLNLGTTYQEGLRVSTRPRKPPDRYGLNRIDFS